MNYLLTVYWPIARAQSLASVPGRGGHSYGGGFGFRPRAFPITVWAVGRIDYTYPCHPNRDNEQHHDTTHIDLVFA